MDPDIRPYPRSLVSMNPGRLVPGAIGGLAAGVVFGALMHYWGIMGAVAEALRTDSLLLAWLVHLVVATLFGVIFGAIADVATMGAGLAWGIAWGIALFGLAGTLLFSALLQRPVQFDDPARRFLVGHILYGAILGAIYVSLRTRTEEPEEDAARYPTGQRTS